MSSLLHPFHQVKAPNRQRAPNKRMQVLCLGLSRSGTDSLRAALQILGYENVYHGFVLTAYQREDCVFWNRILRRKLAGESLGAVEFDSCLGNCEALTDAPANIFGPELMDYYPKAKVILNRRRDVDAWFQSLKVNCLGVFSWPMWVFSWFDPLIDLLWNTFGLSFSGYYRKDFKNDWRGFSTRDFIENGTTVFQQHYDGLEEACRDRDREWLDWSVDDGWDPLCQYLGKPIPDVPFPNANKGGAQFEQNMEEATKDMMVNALKNMSIFFVALIAIGAALVYKDVSVRSFLRLFEDSQRSSIMSYG